MEPKEIAARADALATNMPTAAAAELATLVAELARGLDVFFSTLQDLGRGADERH